MIQYLVLCENRVLHFHNYRQAKQCFNRLAERNQRARLTHLLEETVSVLKMPASRRAAHKEGFANGRRI